MNRILSIDLETYSDVDIMKVGLYRYVQSPQFQIMLLGFAWDDEPVQLIDLTENNMNLRAELLQFKEYLLDPTVLKTAFNAKFEIECLSKLYETQLSYNDWLCTQALASYAGLPANLAGVAKVLDMGQDLKKARAGKALIQYFCKPCKPTSKNGMRTRNLPHHDKEKWQIFKDYCMQDVRVERAARIKLGVVPFPNEEKYQWQLDAIINKTGVAVDTALVDAAVQIDCKERETLMAELIDITGLENPNSVAQLKKWVNEEDEELESLSKKAVSDLLVNCEKETVCRALQIRQMLSKSSIKKYNAIQNTICEDNRVRGLLHYYGANRTGRWAGRLVQMQNLPKNYIDALELARTLVKTIKPITLKLIWGDISSVLSQLIRTAFVPIQGHQLVVADFAAIEARIIAWMANEKWRLDVFATHGKIYEASASAMFGVPLEKIKKGNAEYALRAKGKIAELALGYQGGVNALKAMGAVEMGLTDEELTDIVYKWRGANRNIVEMWYSFQNAAMNTIQTGVAITLSKNITLKFDGENFTISLPSGRSLYYRNAKIEMGDRGYEQITYYGVDDKKNWGKLNTYGGKLVENVVQAIARDCLAVSLKRTHEAGHKIVMHVHDEMVIEEPTENAKNTEQELYKLMAMPIDWAPGLILRGDGFISEFYKKE